jgi:alpha-tubulin suppressor-like RCC1 family protein
LWDAESNWSEVSVTGGLNFGLKSGRAYRWGAQHDAASASGYAVIDAPELDNEAQWRSAHAASSYIATRCALSQDHAMFCWGGNNRYGQLGVGDTDPRTSPTRLGTSSDWSDVQPGEFHSCALTPERLYCWGYNADGRLGLGPSVSGVDVLSPTQVGVDSGWSHVALGSSHTCGIRNGSLYCWGAGFVLGLGQDAPSAWSPVQVGTFGDALSLSAEGSTTCVLRGPGTLQCWGYDSGGQLGLGESSVGKFVAVPTTVVGDWMAVEVGSTHTCGLKFDRTAWCWGSNDSGQLGIGASWSDEPMRVEWP